MSSLFARNAKVEMAPMKDETVLFNPANNKFCVLNATAAFIWQFLDEPKTVEQITSGLQSTFANVDPKQAEKDVRQALEALRGIDCVVVS
jgi:hypothetical protein